MFNGSNCDRKSQLSGILTEPRDIRKILKSKPFGHKSLILVDLQFESLFFDMFIFSICSLKN